MNVPRDPEAIVAGWLEEGPDRLPEPTRRAIAVTIRTTGQRRRSSWAPFGIPLGGSAARLAVAAIAVVVVVGGTVYLIGPGQGTVGSPSTWTPTSSSRFHYSIEYPSDWTATAATEDWPASDFPTPFGPAVDRYGTSHDSDTYVFVTSDALHPGEVVAERIAQLDSDNALACQTSGRHSITLDGVEARQEDEFCFGKDHLIEVTAFHGGRFYQVDLLSSDPISASLRATFERFLASFRFGG